MNKKSVRSYPDKIQIEDRKRMITVPEGYYLLSGLTDECKARIGDLKIEQNHNHMKLVPIEENDRYLGKHPYHFIYSILLRKDDENI